MKIVSFFKQKNFAVYPSVFPIKRSCTCPLSFESNTATLFSCNEKMCNYLLEQFEIHGVPLKSNLICEAFYRTCRGEPIFPLADSSKDLPKRRIKCNNK